MVFSFHLLTIFLVFFFWCNFSNCQNFARSLCTPDLGTPFPFPLEVVHLEKRERYMAAKPFNTGPPIESHRRKKNTDTGMRGPTQNLAFVRTVYFLGIFSVFFGSFRGFFSRCVRSRWPAMVGQRSKQADPPRVKSEAIAKQVTLRNRVAKTRAHKR